MIEHHIRAGVGVLMPVVRQLQADSNLGAVCLEGHENQRRVNIVGVQKECLNTLGQWSCATDASSHRLNICNVSAKLHPRQVWHRHAGNWCKLPQQYAFLEAIATGA